jgi:histone deacetylase 11
VTAPRIVYSRHYNIGLLGLERLHPFDSRKYARAYKELRRRLGRSRLRRHVVTPPRPVGRDELLTLHTPKYLEELRDPRAVASILEVPPLRRLPRVILERAVLKPMRWAAMGTIVATQLALDHGLAFNLSGGYHHAAPDRGHGFCVYADVGLAVQHLRRTARLADEDRIVYIDLDAHQGDGVCRTFFDDRRVFIYDQYNRDIFPRDAAAQRRIDCNVPLASGCSQSDYLDALRTRLPPFLDSVTRSGRLRLAIYNAGTDTLAGDPLGALNLSPAAVLERDRFVIDQLRQRNLPAVFLPSGGYTRQSYLLIANTVACSILGES